MPTRYGQLKGWGDGIKVASERPNNILKCQEKETPAFRLRRFEGARLPALPCVRDVSPIAITVTSSGKRRSDTLSAV
jgi:hypothetical protein